MAFMHGYKGVEPEAPARTDDRDLLIRVLYALLVAYGAGPQTLRPIKDCIDGELTAEAAIGRVRELIDQ